MLDMLRRILHMEDREPVERVDIRQYDAALTELDRTIGALEQRQQRRQRRSGDIVTGLVRGDYADIRPVPVKGKRREGNVNP